MPKYNCAYHYQVSPSTNVTIGHVDTYAEHRQEQGPIPPQNKQYIHMLYVKQRQIMGTGRRKTKLFNLFAYVGVEPKT